MKARLLLWLGLLLALPLPMFLFGARIPVARFLLLAGVSAGLIVAEGPGRVPWMVLALLLAHALVYAGLLWLLARALAAGLRRLAPARSTWLAAGLVAAGLAAALWTEPYRTPFAAESPRASLVGALR